MTIKTLVGINNCTLLVYYCSDQTYRFSVVDTVGKTYTCDSSFPTLGSAKLMGISITELAIDSNQK